MSIQLICAQWPAHGLPGLFDGPVRLFIFAPVNQPNIIKHENSHQYENN
jgi:hypothetical protein